MPATFRLFELVGNEYRLNFLDGMTGRIALPAGISDLSALKDQAWRTKQGAYQIRLTEDCRGQVVLGDTAFLFQFVERPPTQPKSQLPMAVLRVGSAIDWNTTIIAAVSFLVHFLLLDSSDGTVRAQRPCAHSGVILCAHLTARITGWQPST